MADEMFFSADGKTLRKGRRIAARTPVERPAGFWCADDRGGIFQGLVRNLNPYGLLLESDQGLPVGTELWVELKRDELFADALSCVKGTVVRVADVQHGVWHMGVQLVVAPPKAPSKPLRITPKNATLPERRPTRMYSVDYVVGSEEQ
jgi:hypothetical protein